MMFDFNLFTVSRNEARFMISIAEIMIYKETTFYWGSLLHVSKEDDKIFWDAFWYNLWR